MFFYRFEYHVFYVLYPFVTYLLALPRTFGFSGFVFIGKFEMNNRGNK
jgi:hypothetical protein